MTIGLDLYQHYISFPVICTTNSPRWFNSGSNSLVSQPQVGLTLLSLYSNCTQFQCVLQHGVRQCRKCQLAAFGHGSLCALGEQVSGRPEDVGPR